jgi:EpsI family protein
MSSAVRLLRPLLNGWLLTIGLVLVAQAAILRQLSVREVHIRVPELSSLPRDFGAWKATGDQTLEPGVLSFLRPDGYVLRDYVNPKRGRSVNLFVAFFKSLQNTAGPHSPKDCLPGNGWLIVTSSVPKLSVPGWDEPISVNQYTMEKAGERILVVYWYQNDRHVWAEEFRAKLTLLPDLIRYRRSDVSLVRLITPMQEGGLPPAFADTKAFANAAFPSLAQTFRETD